MASNARPLSFFLPGPCCPAAYGFPTNRSTKKTLMAVQLATSVAIRRRAAKFSEHQMRQSGGVALSHVGSRICVHPTVLMDPTLQHSSKINGKSFLLKIFEIKRRPKPVNSSTTLPSAVPLVSQFSMNDREGNHAFHRVPLFSRFDIITVIPCRSDCLREGWGARRKLRRVGKQ